MDNSLQDYLDESLGLKSTIINRTAFIEDKAKRMIDEPRKKHPYSHRELDSIDNIFFFIDKPKRNVNDLYNYVTKFLTINGYESNQDSSIDPKNAQTYKIMWSYLSNTDIKVINLDRVFLKKIKTHIMQFTEQTFTFEDFETVYWESIKENSS